MQVCPPWPGLSPNPDLCPAEATVNSGAKYRLKGLLLGTCQRGLQHASWSRSKGYGQINVGRSCSVIWSAVGLCAPPGLPVSIERVRLSILTDCLLFPCVDVLRC